VVDEKKRLHQEVLKLQSVISKVESHLELSAPKLNRTKEDIESIKLHLEELDQR